MVPFMSMFLDVSALIRDETPIIPETLGAAVQNCTCPIRENDAQERVVHSQPPGILDKPSFLNFFMKKSTFERVVPGHPGELLRRDFRQHRSGSSFIP
jgi:hypothetical protein